jgi:hypothetical protein
MVDYRTSQRICATTISPIIAQKAAAPNFPLPMLNFNFYFCTA